MDCLCKWPYLNNPPWSENICTTMQKLRKSNNEAFQRHSITQFHKSHIRLVTYMATDNTIIKLQETALVGLIGIHLQAIDWHVLVTEMKIRRYSRQQKFVYTLVPCHNMTIVDFRIIWQLNSSRSPSYYDKVLNCIGTYFCSRQ